MTFIDQVHRECVCGGGWNKHYPSHFSASPSTSLSLWLTVHCHTLKPWAQAAACPPRVPQTLVLLIKDAVRKCVLWWQILSLLLPEKEGKEQKGSMERRPHMLGFLSMGGESLWIENYSLMLVLKSLGPRYANIPWGSCVWLLCLAGALFASLFIELIKTVGNAYAWL